MSFGRLVSSGARSGIVPALSPSRALEVGGLFQQGQGRVCSQWLHKLRAGSPSKFKRFVSNGGTPEKNPEMTHEECVKMIMELNKTTHYLRRKMKFVNGLINLMLGLNAGVIITVSGQYLSNIKEKEQRDDELSKAQEDLQKGLSTLARTEDAVAGLKKLCLDVPADSTTGKATPPS